jgi:TRAP transporter TAXI family solute receptor
MSTGTTDGNYYPFGSALAKIVGEKSDYLVINVQASTDSVENISRIANGESQLALAQNDIISYAFHGTDIWQDKEPVTTMAPLMTLYPEICQLVVSTISGITTVDDLVGKRVGIGKEGSALNAGALKILEEYGITENDIDAMPLNFSDAAEAMREKTIDAFFVTVGTPNKGIMDLQGDRDIAIIGFDEEVIAALISKYPFYTRYTLDGNDYSFLTEPVNTVAVRATLVAFASLSDQSAYDIVKTIIENSDAIAVVHAKGMYINVEEAVKGLPLELHPGAYRYFKEAGVLTIDN